MSRRTVEYVVPGRVELVGKHVDYAGGRSLTCATTMALRAVATPIDARAVRLDAQRGAQYADAVARRFFRDFPNARRGVSLTIASDLPESAGLSSSTALVVASAMALVDANEMQSDSAWHAAVPTTLAFAEYCAAMETGERYGSFAGDPGVGVRGGAQDHVAVLCSRAEHVGQFSYLPPVNERYVPWPQDYVLVIANSGVIATKTGNALAAYNALSDEARKWARTPAANAPPELVARVTQFREETDVIVPGVGDALRDGDFARLGALVDRSQALAERVLANQVPETVFLAREARAGGAVAASGFGAGFGGAVWAMVRAEEADRFTELLRASYARAFPSRAGSYYVTRPAPPAWAPATARGDG